MKLKSKTQMNIDNNKYFQARDPPTPLNIPTPTPAPDQGGSIACLGVPVACLGAPDLSRREALETRKIESIS